MVLRRWPYSENSLVAHVLTPEHGVVPLLAKGVYRLSSGKAGVLDTHALVDISFHQREDQELCTLADATLLDRFSALSRQRESLQVCAVLAELAELAAPAGQSSPQVFVFLVNCLQELQSGAEPHELLARRCFEALRLLGLQPDFDAATAGHDAWFSIDLGRLQQPSAPRPEGTSIRLTSAQIQSCIQLAAAGPEPTPVPSNDLRVCLTMMGRFLAFHLERPPRAWKDYEEGALLAHVSR